MVQCCVIVYKLKQHTGAIQMTTRIEFIEGYYRINGVNTSMAGKTFEVIKAYCEQRNRPNKPNKLGYVTVDGGTCSPRVIGVPNRPIRIRCPNPRSFRVITGSMEDIESRSRRVETIEMTTTPEETVTTETDDEIIARLRERFDILKEMTRAVKSGTVRAMIVSGPPGVGKSFGVEEVLHKDDLFNVLGDRKPKYEVVKGAMSAIGLYKKLYEFSGEKHVVVFDDCDSVLLDDVALNILKGALDSSKRRTISWNTDSRLLRSEGIPDRFDFKGGAIFITNIKFENVRSKKLQDHLAALESRCHYIDLKMDTDREKMLRIRQIISDGMLSHYKFDSAAQDEIIDYIANNRDKLRELSLRTVLKVADLRKSFPHTWESMARVTVQKRT